MSWGLDAACVWAHVGLSPHPLPGHPFAGFSEIALRFHPLKEVGKESPRLAVWVGEKGWAVGLQGMWKKSHNSEDNKAKTVVVDEKNTVFSRHVGFSRV